MTESDVILVQATLASHIRIVQPRKMCKILHWFWWHKGLQTSWTRLQHQASHQDDYTFFAPARVEAYSLMAFACPALGFRDARGAIPIIWRGIGMGVEDYQPRQKAAREACHDIAQRFPITFSWTPRIICVVPLEALLDVPEVMESLLLTSSFVVAPRAAICKAEHRQR